MSDLSAIALLLSSTVIGDAWHFGPWAVGCDNIQVCAAMTVLRPDGELGGERQPVVLRVTSHPEPNHKPLIELLDLSTRYDGHVEWAQTQSDNGSVLTIRELRNSAAPKLLRFAFERQDNGNYAVPEKHAAQMLQALKNLSVLELEMPDDSSTKADLDWNGQAGQPEPHGPFKAVLNWFDERRDVHGTAYAIAPDFYDGIDDGAPPAPSKLQAIVRLGFAILDPRERPRLPLPVVESCLPAASARPLGFKLNRITKLWKQECDESNGKGRSIWFLEGNRSIRLLTWPQSDSPALANVMANYRQGTVRAFASGGPNDDCGVIRTWGWTGDGREFRLIEQLEMPLCMGLPSRLWLRTWRTDHVLAER